MEKYIDKSFQTIKQDVRKEFKDLESRHARKLKVIRDDQEIYEAWQAVITKYVSEFLRSIPEDFRVWPKKQEAIKYFKSAEQKLKQKYKDVVNERKWFLGMYVTSAKENEERLDEVASIINNAEANTLNNIKTVIEKNKS